MFAISWARLGWASFRKKNYFFSLGQMSPWTNGQTCSVLEKWPIGQTSYNLLTVVTTNQCTLLLLFIHLCILMLGVICV